MERNERLKAADKCASRYTNENETRIARRAFMLGCEFEAQGEMVKGVVLETEDEHWRPSEAQMNSLNFGINALEEEGYDETAREIKELYEQLKKLMEEF